MKYLTLLMTSVCIGIGGCASVAPKSLDLEAKKFEIPEGKSSVYIVSPFTIVAGTATWDVNMNGKVIGKIGKGSYFWVIAEPGQNFVALANGDFIRPYSKKEPFYFETQPNKAYFINNKFCEDFESMTEEKGKKAVLKAKLVEKVILKYHNQ